MDFMSLKFVHRSLIERENMSIWRVAIAIAFCTGYHLKLIG